MFLSGVLQTFVTQGFQCSDDTETGVTRFDNIVDVAILGSHIRIGESVSVFGFFFGDELGLLLRILDSLDVLAHEDFHSALAAHNSDFGGRPCVVDVAAQVFGAHHAVSATVVLT